MFTGRTRLAFVCVALFLSFSLFSCSKTGKAKGDQAKIEVPPAGREAEPSDVQEELSGIWYRSRFEEVTTPVEDRFSWGVTTYDFWKALRIDLMGGEGFLGLAEATWNDVTAEADRQNKNLIRLHLRQKEHLQEMK